MEYPFPLPPGIWPIGRELDTNLAVDKLKKFCFSSIFTSADVVGCCGSLEGLFPSVKEKEMVGLADEAADAPLPSEPFWLDRLRHPVS